MTDNAIWVITYSPRKDAPYEVVVKEGFVYNFGRAMDKVNELQRQDSYGTYAATPLKYTGPLKGTADALEHESEQEYAKVLQNVRDSLSCCKAETTPLEPVKAEVNHNVRATALELAVEAAKSFDNWKIDFVTDVAKIFEKYIETGD